MADENATPRAAVLHFEKHLTEAPTLSEALAQAATAAKQLEDRTDGGSIVDVTIGLSALRAGADKGPVSIDLMYRIESWEEADRILG